MPDDGNTAGKAMERRIGEKGYIGASEPKHPFSA